MLKNLKNKKKKRGFTLIELIIVIAIIAILALLAIPKFSEIRQSANEKSDIANAKTIANAVTALVAEGKVDVGTDAATPNSFELAKTGNTGDAADVAGYLQNVPTPKSKSGNFSVTISNKGDVIVSAESTPLFPEQ
ncbi:prepilin-type N-terminal cleavage/methylation domain-containing protein [Clostridium sartagoforme]|uniref:Prepilin-type N-terminal cleavage/methylation domain-containing protein n=1 Tax=Clostridium sartagoforme TaxID=84031 RepID=A0A4S2DM82_9CLOT|nr:prepilin-type N-terminal cleavage/methylation domain-containing protein [Clostridium sartagoforme]TGY42163.1 prepilin-type N-terminal cleavage/methylation domain-containing protein [Clostridium sartagoforme]